MTTTTLGASAPTIFTFQNGKPHPVRIYTDAAGEPLFHGGDLCELLEYTNGRDALRRHVETDDVVKRDVIDRMGRTQQANFVREAGMWSLLLGSHAPNAKKVKRWITSEVLPAIRKTGSYHAVPPAPTSDAAHEVLNAKDMGNLTRLVWLICNGLWGGSAWTQAVWFRLRQVTGCAAPNRFQLRHLPILASEVRRIFCMVQAFKDAEREASRLLIKKVLRGGAAEGPVLEETKRLMLEAVASDEAELGKLMERWHEAEVAALTERKQDTYHGGLIAAYAEPGRCNDDSNTRAAPR